MTTGGSGSGYRLFPERFRDSVVIRRSSFTRVLSSGRTSPGRGARSGAMASNNWRGLPSARSERISIRSSAWAVSRARTSAVRPPETSTSVR